MQREGSAHIGQSASRVRHRATPQHQMAREDARVRPSIGIALVAIVAAAPGLGASVSTGRAPLQPRVAVSPFRTHDLGPDAFSVVACGMHTRCLALGPGGWQATSDDGGSSWKLSLDPRLVGLTPDDLACPTPRRCVAIATPVVTSTLSSDVTTQAAELAAPPEVLLVSTDGGRSWRRARAPGDSGWAGCLARRWRFATRAPRRVGSRSALSNQDLGRRASWTAGPKAPPGVSARSLVRASSSASRSVGRLDWR